MFQFLAISLKESVKDYRVYLPWDSLVTEEVWTMTSKELSFTCTEPSQHPDFPAISKTAFRKCTWTTSSPVQHPPGFCDCQRNSCNNRFKSLFVITYKLSPYIYVPSRQHCTFFCPQLKRKKKQTKKRYPQISSAVRFSCCNCYSSLLQIFNFFGGGEKFLSWCLSADFQECALLEKEVGFAESSERYQFTKVDTDQLPGYSPRHRIICLPDCQH